MLRKSCEIYGRYKVLKEENYLVPHYDPLKELFHKRSRREEYGCSKGLG